MRQEFDIRNVVPSLEGRRAAPLRVGLLPSRAIVRGALSTIRADSGHDEPPLPFVMAGDKRGHDERHGVIRSERDTL
jgi:hypothetical protein